MRKRSLLESSIENRSFTGAVENKGKDGNSGADKRWIIGPTIIQDDTPLAPPIEANLNLLGGERLR